MLDQDVPDTLLDRLPHLYAHGRLSQVYKPYSFWLNMVDAMYQSLVIFYVAYGAFAGSDVGIWEFGTVICTECLVVNSLHLAVNIRAWVNKLNQIVPQLRTFTATPSLLHGFVEQNVSIFRLAFVKLLH